MSAPQPKVDSSPTPAQRWLWLAGLLLLFGVALLLRWSASASLGDELYGTDPYYHLRRIWLTLRGFPSVPYLDRFCEYPLDTRCHTWPGGFDWALAAFGRLMLGAQADQISLARLLTIVPPILGATTTVWLTVLLRRPLGKAAALTAGAVFALLPASIMQGAYGRIDHHVVQPLLTLTLLGIYLGARRRRRSTPGRRWWLWLGAALLAGFALFSALPAAIGFLGPLFCIVALDLLRDAVRSTWAAPTDLHSSATPGILVLTAALLGGLLYFSTTPCWSLALDLSPMGLVFGAAALLGLLVWALAVTSTRRYRRLRVPLALGLLLALLVGLLLAFGPLEERVARWLRYLVGSDLGIVTSEWWGLFGDRQSWLNFSPLMLLFAITPLWAWQSWRKRGESEDLDSAAESASWAHFAAAATLLGVAQAAYFRGVVALAVATLAAWSLTRALPAWLERHVQRWVQKRWILPAAGAAIAIALAGWSWQLLPPLGIDRQRAQAFEALRWLARRTPPQDLVAARTPPPYGVLASWELGHWINVVAGRASIASPFLHGPLLAQRKSGAALDSPRCQRGLCQWVRFATTTKLPVARDVLARTRTRYLVLGLLDPAQLAVYEQLLARKPQLARRVGDVWRPGPSFWQLVHQRLYMLNGSSAQRRTGILPAFPELRLRFCSSRTKLKLGGQALPWYKVFEVLPQMATVDGETSPGAMVVLQLELANAAGRQERYQQIVRADAQGRFSLALPYAQRGARPPEPAEPLEIFPSGPYRLRSGDRCASLSVSEAEVRAGQRVTWAWSPCAARQR